MEYGIWDMRGSWGFSFMKSDFDIPICMNKIDRWMKRRDGGYV